jgi:predicted nucleotidyltransferase component of viral defense system
VTSISNNPLLTPEQIRFLLAFKDSPLVESFYLTGGTALSAFYLQHRQSEDLDFFSWEAVAVEGIIGFIKSIPEVVKIHYDRKFDRKLFLLEQREGHFLKVEFTTYPFPPLEQATLVEGVRVDSLLDILANKIMALTDRRDAKDYIDLYWAWQVFPELEVERLVSAAEKKFGIKGTEYIIQGKFLDDIPIPEGLQLTRPINSEDYLNFFRTKAREWIGRSRAEGGR